MTYVRNADLTIEYIVLRAFRLGANSIYTDIAPGHQRAIVMLWNGETHLYPTEEYSVGYHRHEGFAKNLKSFRRFVENHGMHERLKANEK